MRRGRAVSLTVRNNINHPSIMTWSLANEPAGNRSELGIFGQGLARFVEDGAREVRELDDTRFVSIDRQARVGRTVDQLRLPLARRARHQRVLRVVRLLQGRPGAPADHQRGAGPMARSGARGQPNLPLMITEFGAESARDGPANQPGSRQFQSRFVLQHLRIHASKQFVAGSIHWALRDFRVDSDLDRRRPARLVHSPWNNKSLIEEFDERKPVYFELRKRWR